jgi:hypothetical protein
LPVLDRFCKWSTRSDAELDLGYGLGKVTPTGKWGLKFDRLPLSLSGTRAARSGGNQRLGLHSSTQDFAASGVNATGISFPLMRA